MISEYYANLRGWVGHDLLLIPAVACIVRDSEGRLLLQQKKDGSWSLPGGAIEPGESPKDAAIRELKEETGLFATNIRLIDVLGGRDFRYTYPNNDTVEYAISVFACNEVITCDSKLDEETIKLAYFSASKFPGLELPYSLELLYPKQQTHPQEGNALSLPQSP